MTKNARKNYIKAVSQQVDRKKMYKAKKNWVVAGMSFLVMTGLAAVGSHLTTHADAINANTKPNTVKQPSVTDQATQLHNKIMNNNTYKLGAQPKQSSAVANQSTKSSDSNVSSASNQSSTASNNSAKIVKDNKVNTQVNNNTKQAPTNVKNNQVKQSATKNNGNLSTSSTPTKQLNTDSNLASVRTNNSKGLNSSKLTNNNLNRNNKPLIKAHITHNLGDSTDVQSKASDNHWIYDNGKFISSMPNTDNISDGTYKGLTYKYDKTLQALEFTGGSINTPLTKGFLNIQQFGGNVLNTENLTLTSVKFDNDIDTSNVTNMSNMFDNDKALQSLDLGNHFDTSNVTNMSDMFNGDKALQSLDLGNNFNTSNVTDMSGMFMNNDLHSLNLGNHFDTSNVTNMSDMFDADFDLQALNLGNKFDTSKVTDMSGMFKGNDLHSLNLGNHFDTSNVTDMSNMFDDDVNLPSLDLGNHFNTSNVTNMSGMFKNNRKLQSLDLGNYFNTSNVTNMSYMFTNNYSLTSLNLGNNFDTSKVTNINGMFSNDDDESSDNIHTISGHKIILTNVTMPMFHNMQYLQNLNISDIDTSKVTNMSYMFTNNYSLTSLNLGNNFDTSNVTDMSGMFDVDLDLQALNLGDHFDTSNVTNMSNMFNGDSDLPSLNLGNHFDTSNVTNMSNMFDGDGALSSLNLGNKFDTSNVTDMSSMFSLRGAVGGSKLQSLNLGNHFDTSNVTNMSGMFDGDSDLQTLIIQDTNTKISDRQGSDELPSMYKQLSQKDSSGNYYTSPIPNDFTQGNVGTFLSTPSIPSDTINYQYNGNTLATQQFKASASDYNGNGYSNLDVTNNNATSIPNDYILVKKDNTFSYDNNTHNVNILLNIVTNTITFHDIYGDKDGLTPPSIFTKTGKPNSNYTVTAPSGWVFVNANGTIDKSSKTFNYGSNSHVLNIVPVTNGMTFKYNKANNTLEFINNTQSNDKASYHMSDIKNVKSITFDSDAYTGNTTNIDGAFAKDNNLRSITIKSGKIKIKFTGNNSGNNINFNGPIKQRVLTYNGDFLIHQLNRYHGYILKGRGSGQAGTEIKVINKINTQVIMPEGTPILRPKDVIKNQIPLTSDITSDVTLNPNSSDSDSDVTESNMSGNSDYKLDSDAKVSPEYEVAVKFNNQVNLYYICKLNNMGFLIPATYQDTKIDTSFNGVSSRSTTTTGLIKHLSNSKVNSIIGFRSKRIKIIKKSIPTINMPQDTKFLRLSFLDSLRTTRVSDINNMSRYINYRVTNSSNINPLCEVAVRNSGNVGTLYYVVVIKGKPYFVRAIIAPPTSSSTQPVTLNMYKQDTTDNNTAPTPNNFLQGNVGTFIRPENIPLDTVNYQYNGKTLATQQFKANASDYNGNGYNDLDINKSSATSIPSGYHLVNNDNKVPFATGTYNVAIATNSTTDTIHFVNQNNQNMGTTTTATGTPNNTFTISGIPEGYHVDTSKNPKTLTYDGKSHTVHLMSNSIKGTATVHLTYNETNGKVDNTKDVQVPINAHVGDNDMVITPWDYWKPNYNVKSNNVLTISFSPSIASNGDNDSYKQSDTFTYTGLSAANLVVKYVDTDSGAQPINPNHSNNEYIDDNDELVLGTQNLGQLGVVGSQVKLGQKGANDGNGVLDDLQVPKNFDLVNKVNYITLRKGQTVGATNPLGKASPNLVGKRVMILTVNMGTPSTKKNTKSSAFAKPASTKAKQSSVSSAKPSSASKAVAPNSVTSKSVTKKSSASINSAKSSEVKSSASSVASNIAKPSSNSSVQSSAKSSAVSSKTSSKSSSSQSASSSASSVDSPTNFKSVVKSLDQQMNELSLAMNNEVSSAFSMSNSASSVATSSSTVQSTSSSADNGLVNFDDDRLYKVVEVPQTVKHKVGKHQYDKHLLIIHLRKHHALFLEKHHGFVMTLRGHNKISVRKIRYIHIHHGRVVIRLRNGRYVKVSRRYFHRIRKFLRK